MLATAHIWTMPFVYDDPAWLAISAERWSAAGAPFRIGAWLSGGLPWGPHAVVVGLHLLNGALLWPLMREWVSEIGALLALAVFWLHPLPLQAVFYVTGGREVWIATWALLALAAGLRGGVLGWLVGLVALACVGLMKTSAFPLLVLIPILWAASRGYARLVAVLGACVALSTSGPWVVTRDAIAAWSGSLLGYLQLIAWPDQLALIHDWPAPSIAAVGIAVVVAIAWCQWCPSMPWAALWVVGLTLPRALWRDAPPLTEAHMYVPCLAIWLGLGASVDRVFLKESV